MQELYSVSVNGKKIKIIHGDITEEKVDAIVNAANSYLQHGGGVAGAIVRKGGKIIQEESNKIGYVPVGEAAITTAGKLPAKYVIHAVGPRWGEGDEDNKLSSAVKSTLKIATEKGLKSISLPAISSGIFGFPKDRATKIIFNTVVEFLREKETSLEEVRLCNIDKYTCDLFLKVVREFERSTKQSGEDL